MAKSITLSITASSRVGCVRVNNEDMLLLGEQMVRNRKTSVTVKLEQGDRYLLALADGMGGHNGGEVASSDTLNNLKYYFSDLPSGLGYNGFNESVCDWLKSINFIIEAKGREVDECRGMGTTLVALAYFEGAFYSMNCGDSRLYCLSDGKLRQITTDHSLNNLLGNKEHSNIITNCIGGGCSTSYVDLEDQSALVRPGAVFLLCSDGLSDMVSDEEIERLLNHGFDADALCQAAEDEGGLDNVSVIVARVLKIDN
ncbi:MAG: serine/threonine-protein phosphatase [Prevotella sp.]|nr:serine/threonine-protein phosphatase [Prevotella sp.]